MIRTISPQQTSILTSHLSGRLDWTKEQPLPKLRLKKFCDFVDAYFTHFEISGHSQIEWS